MPAREEEETNTLLEGGLKVERQRRSDKCAEGAGLQSQGPEFKTCSPRRAPSGQSEAPVQRRDICLLVIGQPPEGQPDSIWRERDTSGAASIAEDETQGLSHYFRGAGDGMQGEDRIAGRGATDSHRVHAEQQDRSSPRNFSLFTTSDASRYTTGPSTLSQQLCKAPRFFLPPILG